MGCSASTSASVVGNCTQSVPKPKPNVIFVLGGPGSGKGTQCSKIVEKYGYRHISAGDCLREERAKDSSEYKTLIDKYIADGQIVPVEITVALLQQKMASMGGEQPFLIDGFPRNLNNLEGWRTCVGSDVNVLGCLFITCSEETMESRLLKRGETSGRTDDNAESIRKRFQVYSSETLPIIADFRAKDLLFEVNGDRELESVWMDVDSAMNNASKKLFV